MPVATCAQFFESIGRGKQAIRCFGCDKVWHSACTRLETDSLRALDIDEIKWLCTGCNRSELAGSLIGSPGNIEAKLDVIMLELSRMTNQQSKFAKSLNF